MTLFRALAALLATTILVGCTGNQSSVAPGSGPPATSDNRFVWQDLVTTDTAAAQRFYAALLGWEFVDASRSGQPYTIARTAKGPVAGIVDIRNVRDAASQWVSYVAIADIDRTIGQVAAAGGRVVVAPAMTGVGRAGVVIDPQGAALGLLQPSKAPPAQPDSPPVAHFFWREYLAQDANRAIEFYKGLLGYDASNTDTQLGLEYFVLRGGAPRAGLFQIPATTKTSVRPNWLPYVLVDDPAALSAKVAGLGGRVLLDPSADRRNRTLVIVADPTGGVVALQKYPI